MEEGVPFAIPKAALGSLLPSYLQLSQIAVFIRTAWPFKAETVGGGFASLTQTPALLGETCLLETMFVVCLSQRECQTEGLDQSARFNGA